MKTLILTLALLTATSALATKGRGGGVGFKCGEKIYLADTYDFIVEDRAFYEDKFKDFTIDSLVDDSIQRAPFLKSIVSQAFKDTNAKTNLPDRARYITKYLDEGKLKTTLDGMQFRAVREVPYIGDDQIKEIPRGCVKVAIAYQLIDEKVVLYNKSYYSKLTKFEKAYLVLHELMINIENGTMDTTPVRDTISLLTGIKTLEIKIVDKYKSCDMTEQVRRVGWATLRSLHMKYYDAQSASRDGKIIGYLNSKNASSNDLSMYMVKEDLEQFIEDSYYFMYFLFGLRDNKDPNEVFTGGEIFRRDIQRNAYTSPRKYYSLQASESGYANVLRKHYGEMSVCDFVILVDNAFSEDLEEKKKRLSYLRRKK